MMSKVSVYDILGFGPIEETKRESNGGELLRLDTKGSARTGR